jgi:hypothetical protein
MNERIENCLYEAGITAQGCWDELDDYTKECIEKLAELIVADVLDEVLQAMDDGMDVYDTVASKFGVEE